MPDAVVEPRPSPQPAAPLSSADRFIGAFRHAPTGSAILDARGVILEANAALARLVGLPLAHMIGLAAWRLVAPSHRRVAIATYTGMIRSGLEAAEAMLPFRTSRGEDGWARVHVTELAGTGAYVVHVLDLTAQRQAEADLLRRATHDPLTDLANRTLVLDRLRGALRELHDSQLVSLLFVDLDGFKAVNDRYGHLAGDVVLCEIAHRLRTAVRPGDTVGRLGGDEFAVVLSGTRSPAAAAQCARRITRAVSSPVAFDGRCASVSASIGLVTTADPGTDPVRLLEQADAAMYRSKAGTCTPPERVRNRRRRVDALNDTTVLPA